MKIIIGKRGDSVVETMMWSVLVVLTIIVVIWLSKRFFPVQQDLSTIDSDLESMRGIFTDMCNSYSYKRTYIPNTQMGMLSIDNFTFCINSTRNNLCSYSICNLNISTNVSLDNIHNLVFMKNTVNGREIYNVSSQ